MPLIASNIRPVNSSALLVAIIQDVGRSSATTRTRRRCQLGLQFLPVARREARQTVNLLDQQDVTGLRIVEQSEQLGARQLGAALVLDVPGGNRKTSLSSKGLELVARAVGVLINFAIWAAWRPLFQSDTLSCSAFKLIPWAN
jgi:hypothetical protein